MVRQRGLSKKTNTFGLFFFFFVLFLIIVALITTATSLTQKNTLRSKADEPTAVSNSNLPEGGNGGGNCTYMPTLHCTTSGSSCAYTCKVSGNQAEERCVGTPEYEGGILCLSSYWSTGALWSCDTHDNALGICGKGGSGSNNSTPACSIAGVPASAYSGQRINFTLTVSGKSPVTAVYSYPQTNSQRCSQVIGDFSGNLLPGPRSGYYKLGASGGLCSLTVLATDGDGKQINCGASTGILCKPSSTTSQIAYTTQTNLIKGSTCNPNDPCLINSTGPHDNQRRTLNVPKQCNGKNVTAVCVRGDISSVPGIPQYLQFLFKQGVNNNETWKVVTRVGKNSKWYAIPLGMVSPNKQYFVATGFTGTYVNGTSYCKSSDPSFARFTLQ